MWRMIKLAEDPTGNSRIPTKCCILASVSPLWQNLKSNYTVVGWVSVLGNEMNSNFLWIFKYNYNNNYDDK